jgi:hypothetical protein
MSRIRNVGVMTLAAIACAAIGVAAQQGYGAPQSENTSGRVTVIGCIQPADATAIGTSGMSGESDTTKYMLTNARKSPSDMSSSSSSESGMSPGSHKSLTYRLDAEDSTLSPHVGHQVQIVATIDQSSTSSSESATGTSGTSGSSAPSGPVPKLKVESVKMLSATCPAM